MISRRRKRDVTLVMTLLVKNERDIVRQNIDFHLNCGVDHVIAIDNASSDGTRDILSEFERAGVATIVDEPGQDYAQSKWMTQAAFMAAERFSADWILSNDADEFWWCPSGHIKDELIDVEAHKLVCRRHNMVCAYDSPVEVPWHRRLIYTVKNPPPVPCVGDIYSDPLPMPYFYLSLPSKIMVRTDGLKCIRQGNHNADFDVAATARNSKIQIYHFPVRSPETFRQKVTQGAEAYARNKELPELAGWHWRRWYRMMSEQGQQAALADALPSTERLAEDLRQGRVIENRLLCDLLDQGATAHGVSGKQV